MNREPMECPNCKELTLTHFNTETDTSVGTFEEWKCTHCGHYQTMDYLPKEQPEPKRQDFDDWLHTIDLCLIDDMGKVEFGRMAYLAGISAQQDMEIARLKKDISLLKRQAE